MTVTYLDAPKPKSDRVTTGYLLSHLKFHTVIADLLTGVIERREHRGYDTTTIMEWIGDSQKIIFTVATDYEWRAKIPLSEKWKPKTFLIEGSAERIVKDIESIRGWPATGEDFYYRCKTRYLRYKDGKVKMTVSGEPGGETPGNFTG